MTVRDLRVDGRFVELDETRLEFRWPVLTAALIGDRVLLLHDPDSRPGNVGQFRNLAAYNLDGSTCWTAELPTTTTGDCYYRIESYEPIFALSYSSFRCRIDLADGRIIDQTFVK